MAPQRKILNYFQVHARQKFSSITPSKWQLCLPIQILSQIRGIVEWHTINEETVAEVNRDPGSIVKSLTRTTRSRKLQEVIYRWDGTITWKMILKIDFDGGREEEISLLPLNSVLQPIQKIRHPSNQYKISAGQISYTFWIHRQKHKGMT